MGNGGQGELERFGVVSRVKRGFVGSILSTIPVLKGNGVIRAGFRDTFPIMRAIEQERKFYPGSGIGMGK